MITFDARGLFARAVEAIATGLTANVRLAAGCPPETDEPGAVSICDGCAAFITFDGVDWLDEDGQPGHDEDPHVPLPTDVTSPAVQLVPAQGRRS